MTKLRSKISSPLGFYTIGVLAPKKEDGTFNVSRPVADILLLSDAIELAKEQVEPEPIGE